MPGSSSNASAARSQGGERHYDRFRDRIMFPIRDARGRVIAFGGRIIDAGEPKYLNSPETVLFHKGRELYGLYEARRARANLARLIVVEGYMDTVRLHQSGIDYAVATLGTATTAEHLRRLFRLTSAVVFAFDGDRAGRAAAWRALQQALPEAREGREIRFLFLPQGHDPDTLVGAEGRAAFEERLAAAVPLSEYLVRELSEQSELAHADGRARFAEAARPLFAKVSEGVYRELLLERLAQVVGLSSHRLEELWRAGRSSAQPAATPTPARPARARRAARSGGRGSLVRQAIARLLHYPAIASEVSRGRARRARGVRGAGRGTAARAARQPARAARADPRAGDPALGRARRRRCAAETPRARGSHYRSPRRRGRAARRAREARGPGRRAAARGPRGEKQGRQLGGQ